MKCVHCHRKNASRPRGLCWKCFYTPAVRDVYPVTSKYAPKHFGEFNGGYLPPDAPTDARPGTPAKVAVLERRAEQMRSLWHEQDR